MIPTRTSRPFGRPSPRLEEADLADVLLRAIDTRIAAKREQGFATVSVRCDGGKRTTLLDGGSCVTDGDVCLAQRSDGLTVCMEIPSRGNGIVLDSLSFGPSCIPVTGWFILDAAVFLYRLPAALLDAVPYWPMGPETTEAWTDALPALVRAGSWSLLRCGAPIDIIPNGGGGSTWSHPGEGDWIQSYEYLVSVANNPANGWALAGILLRDHLAPNAGVRVGTVTLPTAESGVITGDVSVAYGFPIAFNFAESLSGDTPFGPAPYPAKYTGTNDEADVRGRLPYDMAQVYSARLGVLYGTDHLNLAGDEIATPDATEPLFVGSVPIDPIDVKANLLPTPGGEVILCPASSLYIGGQRYRVRPAPDAPVSVEITRDALGTFGDDPNPWLIEYEIDVTQTTGGGTTFECADGSLLPGRAEDVVLWQVPEGWPPIFQRDSVRVYGRLADVSGTTITIDFGIETPPNWGDGGAGKLTVLGYFPTFWYGWTFAIEDLTAGGRESALSPLLKVPGWQGGDWIQWGPAATQKISVTIPAGPTATRHRNLYRFAIDESSHALVDLAGDNWHVRSPWDARGIGNGAVYDRMFRKVATIDNTLVGDGPVTISDDDTASFYAGESFRYVGTRPPSPLIRVLPDLNGSVRTDLTPLLPPMQLGG